MKTLIVDIKNNKDSEIIKKLLGVFDVKITESKPAGSSKKQTLKSKMKPEDLKAMGGIMKGQLVSKEHLRSISWRRRA